MDENGGNRLKPTIVPTPVRRAKPSGSPATPAKDAPARHDLTTLQPTMVSGASPDRLNVTTAELRRLSPKTGGAVLDAALAVLSPLVPGRMTERKAILWGHDLQRSFADAVADALQLSQQPVMVRMQGHVSRLLEILESFDLAAVARPEAAGISGLLKSFNRKTDTLIELGSARAELAQLVGLMDVGLEGLLALREQLQANAAEQQKMAVEVEANALAALYLAEHFRLSDGAIADRLVERSMSLTQTLAQIRGDESLRNLQVDAPLRTITAIQNVTLVSMPDFLASLGALSTLRSDRAVTPTEARELTHKLRNIVSQLQS
jgi:hypothetical protein